MKLFCFLAAVWTVSLSLSSCKAEQPLEQSAVALPPQQVTVREAELVPVANQIEIIGTVESVYRAEISAKISGTVSTLPVVLGSEVKKGDLLLEISAGEIDARLQQSRAQLSQAQRNLAREKKLLVQNAATPETVKSLEESLAIAEAAHQEALIMQSYTRLLAPFDGRVTSKLANIGDLATPGKPLLNVEDESHLQVITDVPEAMILQVKRGDILSVTIPSAGLTVPGTVAEVAPTTNPTTRSGPVKIDIAPHRHLRPGQFARVAFSEQGIKTLVVPQKALIISGQMERLFIAAEDTVRLRLVRSGARYGESIEILSGVTAGEQVVVTGQHNLQDGQAIVIQ